MQLSVSGNKGLQGGFDARDIPKADRSGKSRFMAMERWARRGLRADSRELF